MPMLLLLDIQFTQHIFTSTICCLYHKIELQLPGCYYNLWVKVRRTPGEIQWAESQTKYGRHPLRFSEVPFSQFLGNKKKTGAVTTQH